MIGSRACFALVLISFLATCATAQEMHPAARSTPAFDQLKTLVGRWEGTTSNGQKVSVSYELVSNGTVLMERLSPGNEPDMITMYSLEGDRIHATHYCSAGNQPTMQTAPSPAPTGRYEFSFLSLSGAKAPDEGHMVALTVSLSGKDQLTQTWTFLENGKSQSEKFTLSRKT